MIKISLLITDKQHKLLKDRAKEREIRMSEQIRRAIDKYFQKLGGDTNG